MITVLLLACLQHNVPEVGPGPLDHRPLKAITASNHACLLFMNHFYHFFSTKISSFVPPTPISPNSASDRSRVVACFNEVCIGPHVSLHLVQQPQFVWLQWPGPVFWRQYEDK